MDTSLQWGVWAAAESSNRFNGLPDDPKTVETVEARYAAPTPH
jgi:hypothetical protein